MWERRRLNRTPISNAARRRGLFSVWKNEELNVIRPLLNQKLIERVRYMRYLQFGIDLPLGESKSFFLSRVVRGFDDDVIVETDLGVGDHFYIGPNGQPWWSYVTFPIETEIVIGKRAWTTFNLKPEELRVFHSANKHRLLDIMSADERYKLKYILA